MADRSPSMAANSTTIHVRSYWGEARDKRSAFVLLLIHQGTRLIPCDFIAFAKTLNPLGPHHDMLFANVFAQAEAFAFGKTTEEVKARRHPRLASTASCLQGQSPFEHNSCRAAHAGDLWQAHRGLRAQRVSQGVIWNIDPFDQSGVELGKVLAQRIVPELKSTSSPNLRHDESTNRLTRRYRRLK